MDGDKRTHGLWEASAPPAPRTSALVADAQAELAIVGAGFTGLSAALHLAERGIDCVVLEARSPGFGGSGRNVGLVNAGMWVMPDELPRVLGPVYGSRLLDVLGNAPALVYDIIERHRIACEAVRRGTLHCALGARGLAEIRRRAQQWGRLGAPVHLLDAEQTARRVGTRAYRGSLLDLRAGTIQPLAYVRGLAAAALRCGARIHTASPVLSWRAAGDGWRLEVAGGASVTARRVLLATNAYTGHGGQWRALRAELTAFPYFNFATAPLVPQAILPGGEGAWDTNRVLSSMRLDAAGRLVFGSVGALRGACLAAHRDWARRRLSRLFPELGAVRFEHEWFGTIGMTADCLPRFHEPAPNLFVFSGYNGRGIGTGTAFGLWFARLAAGEISREEMPLPLTPVRAMGWRGLRELVYECGAGLAHFAGARF